MSINAIEKHAQTLNQALRNQGKTYGKAWRLRIRDLLQQTFAAMNAKPLDGALCKSLDEKISAELEALENGTVVAVAEESASKPSKSEKKKRSTAAADAAVAAGREIAPGKLEIAGVEKTAEISEHREESVEPQVLEDAGAARMAAGHSDAEGEARMAAGHSDAGDTSPDTEIMNETPQTESGNEAEETAKSEDAAAEVGLFDLIHVQIRCFFKIRACVRPPYIGQFVLFSERYGKDVQARVDRFLGVLSKGEDDFAAKTEVEVGYRDDLLPDMPERGLILYPKKEKKR